MTRPVPALMYIHFYKDRTMPHKPKTTKKVKKNTAGAGGTTKAQGRKKKGRKA